jgi:carboxymethylenebutenolidase
VLGLYGGQDKGITAADIADMNAELQKAGHKKSHIETFADAQHGFFADYRPSYNEKDAKQGWSELLTWFGTYIAG